MVAIDGVSVEKKSLTVSLCLSALSLTFDDVALSLYGALIAAATLAPETPVDYVAHERAREISLLKLFSQECICYTSMDRKRSAFKEVSLYLTSVHFITVDSFEQ